MGRYCVDFGFLAPTLTEIKATRWITIWGVSGEPNESSQVSFLGTLALIYLAQAFFGVVQMIVPVLFGLKASSKVSANGSYSIDIVML